MHISEATLNDKAGWEDLYRQYADFYQMPMSQEILDNVWSWIQDPQEAFYCIIAKDHQGNAVALMHVRAMPSPLRGSKVGFLDDLYIVPTQRGSGILQQLFQALEAKAQQQGWPFVRWITADSNLRAQAAYAKVSQRTTWLTYQLDLNK